MRLCSPGLRRDSQRRTSTSTSCFPSSLADFEGAAGLPTSGVESLIRVLLSLCRARNYRR